MYIVSITFIVVEIWSLANTACVRGTRQPTQTQILVSTDAEHNNLSQTVKHLLNEVNQPFATNSGTVAAELDTLITLLISIALSLC